MPAQSFNQLMALYVMVEICRCGRVMNMALIRRDASIIPKYIYESICAASPHLARGPTPNQYEWAKSAQIALSTRARGHCQAITQPQPRPRARAQCPCIEHATRAINIY